MFLLFMQYCTVAVIRGVTGHYHQELTLMLPPVTHAITSCFLVTLPVTCYVLLLLKSQHEAYAERVC